MNYYKFVGINCLGEKIKGSDYFENRDKLYIHLRSKGYYLISSSSGLNFRITNVLSFVNFKDISIFSKQLSSMLAAGFNISEALKIIMEQIYNKSFIRNIKVLEYSVREGNSFYDSIAHCKNIFPKFYIEMINVGEQSGNLDVVLKNLANYYMKEFKIQRKIKSSMIYPIIILLASIFILFYIEIKVVPMFSDTFNSLGTELPVYSKCLMDLSFGIKQNFFLIIIGVFTFLLLFLSLLKFKILQPLIDKYSVYVPLLGKYKIKIIGARFTRCLGISHKSGLDLIKSLEMGSKVLNNSFIEKEINDILNDIRKGNSIGETLKKLSIFPQFIISMIALGEQGGNLEEMLIMAADIYDEDIDDFLERLVSIIEPAMIIVLSIFVAFIIISIMVPMLKMMQAI